jgi:hypothetical protein
MVVPFSENAPPKTCAEAQFFTICHRVVCSAPFSVEFGDIPTAIALEESFLFDWDQLDPNSRPPRPTELGGARRLRIFLPQNVSIA